MQVIHVMMKESSAGAIIFSINSSSDVSFLLLQHNAGHWDFAKGNIEYGENESQAARREIREETGIESVHFLEGFRVRVEYYYKREGNLVHKEVVFFLARSDSQRVTLSHEHIGYLWCDFDKSLAKLTYRSARDVLEQARSFIMRTRLN
jgi:bis(5'-nucleosidyl)-tetraphosphatase